MRISSAMLSACLLFGSCSYAKDLWEEPEPEDFMGESLYLEEAGTNIEMDWGPGQENLLHSFSALKEESIGLKRDGTVNDGELIDWMIFGFPILPPAEGEKIARVSRPHAELWRLMFGLLIGTLGGNGMALHLGREAHKLRGLPLDLYDDIESREIEQEAEGTSGRTR